MTPVPTFLIQNIATDCSLNCTIDLKLLTHLGSFKEDHLKLKASVLWLKDPKSSALIFAKGRMVVVGMTSETLAIQAMMRAVRAIKPFYPEARMSRYRTNNILATGKFSGDWVDIERYARDDNTGSDYSPEKFPGLRLNVQNPRDPTKRLTATVFMSGRIVLQGACSLTDVKARLDFVMQRLLPYVVTDGTQPKSHTLLIKEQRELKKALKRDFLGELGSQF
jgi:transcription initiation factor TFIID TATA-box-binding protein